MNAVRSIGKNLVYVFFLANLVWIVYFWNQTNWRFLLNGSLDLKLITLGRISGLLAVYFILTQLILIGRVAWVEKLFGLDKLSRAHHYNGFLALFFIILHPVLLGLGYGGLANYSLIMQLQVFTGTFIVLLAVISLAIFALAVLLSIAIVKKRLKYEYWYAVHLLAYLAIALAIAHQFNIGTDLNKQPNALYFAGLYVFVSFNYISFRFIRPIYNFFKHGFYVERVVKETEDAVSIYIAGRNLGQFKILPGQFMIFRFLDWPYIYEAHPFSLSNYPNGKNIRITVKKEGDFTEKIKNIRPGTKILIDGPNGIFTEKVLRNEKVLFIAGGVGITPIRSLVESMAKRGKDLALLYSNRTENDIIFRGELEGLCQAGRYPLFHVITAQKDLPVGQDGWPIVKGRLDVEKIKGLVPDFKERDIYLCGPPPMMDALKKQLKTEGYNLKQLHFEKFSL